MSLKKIELKRKRNRSNIMAAFMCLLVIIGFALAAVKIRDSDLLSGNGSEGVGYTAVIHTEDDELKEYL